MFYSHGYIGQKKITASKTKILYIMSSNDIRLKLFVHYFNQGWGENNLCAVSRVVMALLQKVSYLIKKNDIHTKTKGFYMEYLFCYVTIYVMEMHISTVM